MADKTVDYYNKNASKYITDTINADMKNTRDRFLAHLPVKACILDAGCGSGRDSKAFLAQGYYVQAIDASEEFCRYASEYLGIPVQCCRFQDITEVEKYDGVWACASLLHVPREELPDVMLKIYKALKPDGVLYASFKKGDQDMVKDGRSFTNMTSESLRELAKQTGFTVEELFCTDDVRSDHRSEAWVNLIARKQETK